MLAGDVEAAERVELELPETGVCKANLAPGEESGGGCCAPAAAPAAPSRRAAGPQRRHAAEGRRRRRRPFNESARRLGRAVLRVHRPLAPDRGRPRRVPPLRRGRLLGVSADRELGEPPGRREARPAWARAACLRLGAVVAPPMLRRHRAGPRRGDTRRRLRRARARPVAVALRAGVPHAGRLVPGGARPLARDARADQRRRVRRARCSYP